MNIIFFGECMVEKSIHEKTEMGVNKELKFGGDTLNSALYFSRLNENNAFNIFYATAVGTDKLSQSLLKEWKSEMIDTRLVIIKDNKTVGSYEIKTDKDGERCFNYNRSDSAVRYYFENKLSSLEKALKNGSCDYFYFSGISLAILSDDDKLFLIGILKNYKKMGGKIIFDSNYRPQLWTNSDPQIYYQYAMNLADIAFLSDEDEYTLYSERNINQIIERLKKYTINEVIIKQGKNPCVIINKSQKISVAGQKAEHLVDTCAAGDSFSAGYLSKRLNGFSIEDSAKYGHQIAAQVIQYSGAIVPKRFWSTPYS